jgi:hypothetical protein
MCFTLGRIARETRECRKVRRTDGTPQLPGDLDRRVGRHRPQRCSPRLKSTTCMGGARSRSRPWMCRGHVRPSEGDRRQRLCDGRWPQRRPGPLAAEFHQLLRQVGGRLALEHTSACPERPHQRQAALRPLKENRICRTPATRPASRVVAPEPNPDPSRTPDQTRPGLTGSAGNSPRLADELHASEVLVCY